jgi:hypothetical protein
LLGLTLFYFTLFYFILLYFTLFYFTLLYLLSNKFDKIFDNLLLTSEVQYRDVIEFPHLLSRGLSLCIRCVCCLASFFGLDLHQACGVKLVGDLQ